MNPEEIHQACNKGDLKALESILKQSPNCLNTLDPKLGWPPLYRCIVYGILETAEILLKYGADPNVQNRLGQAPLHHTCETNQIFLTNLLLQYSADPDLQKNDGDTALHIACYKGHLEIVKVLLKAKANPNIPNKVLGRTPLHYAFERNYPEIIEELLKFRADPSRKDANSLLACELACEKDLAVEIPVSKDSIHEPESEKTIFYSNRLTKQTNSLDEKPSALYAWLLSYKLERFFENFQDNGFDDLDLLLDANKGNIPITEEILINIGIDKVGYRLRLLSRLEEQCINSSRYSICNNSKMLWCSSNQKNTKKLLKMPLKAWLKGLNLEFLFENFEENGLDDIEDLFVIMNSSYPLTDQILENQLKIAKIGHRHRILSKLNPENRVSMRLDKLEKITACDCLIT